MILAINTTAYFHKNKMTKITIKKADITTLAVDAIVNAANKSLLGGGGVDGAIHVVAGPELLAECETLGGCEIGQAKITKGYNLPAKHVIHTVGPVYGAENGQEATLLASCYRNSLELARKHKLKTIAFPCISTGVFRYPKDEAASIALKTAREYIKEYPEAFDEIIFSVFDDWDLNIYNELI
jgi:O-acetyl-ADP-ribose deacetylase (regulator of RNase III)